MSDFAKNIPCRLEVYSENIMVLCWSLQLKKKAHASSKTQSKLIQMLKGLFPGLGSLWERYLFHPIRMAAVTFRDEGRLSVEITHTRKLPGGREWDSLSRHSFLGCLSNWVLGYFCLLPFWAWKWDSNYCLGSEIMRSFYLGKMLIF